MKQVEIVLTRLTIYLVACIVFVTARITNDIVALARYKKRITLRPRDGVTRHAPTATYQYTCKRLARGKHRCRY